MNGVPDGAGAFADNVCDPTGGFDFTPQTMANFGKINLKRGHRVDRARAEVLLLEPDSADVSRIDNWGRAHGRSPSLV